METITLEPQITNVQSPEILKQQAFGDVARKILMGIKLEMGNTTHFENGGRSFEINSDAAGVKAFGQLVAKCADDVYKTIH